MWTQQEESGYRVRVLGELIYFCYGQRFPRCSLREVRGHRLLELRLHLGLIAKEAHVSFTLTKTKCTDLADDDAFYAFYASASSLPHHLAALLPRPRPQ